MFGEHFNQHVDRLPPNLKHLQLGTRFEKPLDHLPDSLEKLSLDPQFSVTWSGSLDYLPTNLRVCFFVLLWIVRLVGLGGCTVITLYEHPDFTAVFMRDFLRSTQK